MNYQFLQGLHFLKPDLPWGCHRTHLKWEEATAKEFGNTFSSVIFFYLLQITGKREQAHCFSTEFLILSRHLHMMNNLHSCGGPSGESCPFQPKGLGKGRGLGTAQVLLISNHRRTLAMTNCILSLCLLYPCGTVFKNT